MNEDHARRVAEIEALAADYTEALEQRMRGQWAADWQRIANTFAVPVGHFATRPGMTYIGPVRPQSIIGENDV
jgi:hypothetical protein